MGKKTPFQFTIPHPTNITSQCLRVPAAMVQPSHLTPSSVLELGKTSALVSRRLCVRIPPVRMQRTTFSYHRLLESPEYTVLINLHHRGQEIFNLNLQLPMQVSSRLTVLSTSLFAVRRTQKVGALLLCPPYLKKASFRISPSYTWGKKN